MSRFLLFVTLLLLSAAGVCQNKLSPQSLLRFGSTPKVVTVTRDHRFLVALWEWNRPTKFPANLQPDANIRTQIQVWELDEERGTARKTRTFASSEYGIENIAISPNGALVAVVCNDRKLRLWRVSDGTIERTITAPKGQVFNCCEFLTDNQSIAVGGRELDLNPNAEFRISPLENNFQILDITSGRILLGAKPGYSVDAISFAPDGRHFAINTLDPTLNLVFGHEAYGSPQSNGLWGIWDGDSKLFGPGGSSRFDNRDPFEPFDESYEAVMRFQFSNDSRKFVHGQFGRAIMLGSLRAGRGAEILPNAKSDVADHFWLAKKFNSSPQRIAVCSLSPDGSRVIWADDTSLLFWDAKTGKTSEPYDIGLHAEYLDMSDQHRVLVQSGSQVSSVFLPN